MGGILSFGLPSLYDGLMRVTIELPVDLEARFVAEAKAKGLPLDEVVKAYLHQAPRERSPERTAEEVDRGLEQAADLIPDGIPPLPDEAMSRESIYTREDDWNR
jgi:hypothetical protein